MRGLAEQAESTESERFKEPTDLLLSAREVSPRTNLPANETVSQEGREVPSFIAFGARGGPLNEIPDEKSLERRDRRDLQKNCQFLFFVLA